MFLKEFYEKVGIEKKISRHQQKHENYPACKELDVRINIVVLKYFVKQIKVLIKDKLFTFFENIQLICPNTVTKRFNFLKHLLMVSNVVKGPSRITPHRRQSKTLISPTNADKKLLDGDRWQSKTLFLAIFFIGLLRAFSIAAYPL